MSRLYQNRLENGIHSRFTAFFCYTTPLKRKWFPFGITITQVSRDENPNPETDAGPIGWTVPEAVRKVYKFD